MRITNSPVTRPSVLRRTWGFSQSAYTQPARTSTRSISPVTSVPSSDGGPNRLPAAARRLSKSVESRDELDPKLPALNMQVDPRCSKELREKYKSLIRHLPAKSYVDQLVSVYFKEVNWHYHVIEEDEFMRMLDSWSQIPFEVFQKTGPLDLSPDMRVFPALLFQILATVLLVVPDEPRGPFESLKYVGTMSLRDLAVDYSESGTALLSLVGSTHVTITTVQAGMVRAMLSAYLADILGSVRYSYPFPAPSLACPWLGYLATNKANTES